MDYSNFIGKTYDPNYLLKPYIHQYSIANVIHPNRNQVSVKSIPFGMAGIILFFDHSGMNLYSGKSGIRRLKKACLIGFNPIQQDNYIMPTGDRTKGVMISMSYLGVNHLLHLPLKVLCNEMINLEFVLGNKIEFLLEQLHEVNSDHEIITKLDEFFIQLLSSGNKVNQPFLSQLNHILTNNSQIVNVNELATQSNMHERSLQRKFKEEIGLTPKEFLRLMRFIKILTLISSNPKVQIQDLIWMGKFYDQAHLIHEFQQVTNYSPAEFHRHFKILADQQSN